jgi:hypothetical protein
MWPFKSIKNKLTSSMGVIILRFGSFSFEMGQKAVAADSQVSYLK